LWSALSEILWNIGEKTKVIVAIPGENPHIPHTQTYFQDTVTEKLYLFEFMKLDDLQIFVKLHITHVSSAVLL
jgi:ubiquitin carboxyl-terminal hydrolase MINDY-3/4